MRSNSTGGHSSFDISEVARLLGRRGGARATEAQKAAARENGKKGGRPRNPEIPTVWVDSALYQDPAVEFLSPRAINLLCFLKAHPSLSKEDQVEKAKSLLNLSAEDFQNVFGRVVETMPRLAKYFEHEKPKGKAAAKFMKLTYATMLLISLLFPARIARANSPTPERPNLIYIIGHSVILSILGKLRSLSSRRILPSAWLGSFSPAVAVLG